MNQGVLYIGAIPGHLSDEEILAYFKQFSLQAKLKIVRYPKRNPKCDMFGFLTIPIDVIPIIQRNEHFLASKQLIIEEHLSYEKSILIKNSLKRRRVFVRGIKKDISEQDLFQAFSRVGPLESAYIIKDQLNNKSRSFGYVTFIDEELAFKVSAAGTLTCKGVKLHVHPFLKNSSPFNMNIGHVESNAHRSISDQPSIGMYENAYNPLAKSNMSYHDVSSNTIYNLGMIHPSESWQIRFKPQPTSELNFVRDHKPMGFEHRQGEGVPNKGEVPNHGDSSPNNNKQRSNHHSMLSSSRTGSDGLCLSNQTLKYVVIRQRTNIGGNQPSDDERSSMAWLSDQGYLQNDGFSGDDVHKVGRTSLYWLALPKPTQRCYHSMLGEALSHETLNLRFNTVSPSKPALRRI